MMYLSAFTVTTLGLLNPFVTAFSGKYDSVPMETAIRYDTLEAFQADADRFAKEFGNLLAETERDASDDAGSSGTGRRRLLNMPDYWYEDCVDQINMVRAKEGLPALMRWKNFEPCTDRGTAFDAKNNIYHGAFSQKKFCDFANYFPIAQNACPKWFHDTDSNRHCTLSMWNEKYLLEDNKTCLDGEDGNTCAGHYYALRGGADGYNAYDRVACGFYVAGNDELWINHNYGSGTKTNVNAIPTLEDWVAPDGWTPQDFMQPGYACGGDVNTQPASLYVEDCTYSAGVFQYDDCRNEYRIDYHWWACVEPTCDMTYDGSCVDFTVGDDFDILPPVGEEGAGFDMCNDPILNLAENGCESYATRVYVYPEGSRKYFYTSEVCRQTCGTCSCPVEEFEVGFTPTPPPTYEPTLQTLEPTLEPTIHPTYLDQECADNFTSKNACKVASGCQWGRSGPCQGFDGDCSALSKKPCGGAFGCEWNRSNKECRHI